MRQRAARIRIREQYPGLSQEERDLLVQDALAHDREQKRRHDDHLFDMMIQMPSSVHCTTTYIAGTAYTDCY